MIELLRRLLMAGIALGAIAGNADQIKEFFDNTVKVTENVTNAADMRTISMLLDKEFIMHGVYPDTRSFRKWMDLNFKENNLKSIYADQWGNSFVYEAAHDNRAYLLLSLGPDGLRDTEDDMRITGP